MPGKLAEHRLGMRESAPKRPQEGIEVTSPRRALAPDKFLEPSRTSSDCSRVDRRADGQDFQQQIIGLVQAEFDEHVLHYKRIIAAKTRKIKTLKRQLTSVKKLLG